MNSNLLQLIARCGRLFSPLKEESIYILTISAAACGLKAKHADKWPMSNTVNLIFYCCNLLQKLDFDRGGGGGGAMRINKCASVPRVHPLCVCNLDFGNGTSSSSFVFLYKHTTPKQPENCEPPTPSFTTSPNGIENPHISFAILLST